MTDTAFYKGKLEEQKAHLEKELSTVAEEKTPTEGDWQAKGTLIDESIDADPNEVADKIEEFETNQAITDSLRAELNDVNDALEKIEKGTYGVCEVCAEVIEEDRLKANPSAPTCKTHINS